MNYSGKYLFTWFILFFCPACLVYGRVDKVDSLNTALTNSKEDTSKLKLLVQLSEVCELNQIINYALPAVELADKLLTKNLNAAARKKILSQKSLALNNIGYIYRNRGDARNALLYHEQSLKIREETKDKNGIANSLNNIGLVHEDQGYIDKALDYYTKSLKLFEEIGNKQGLGQTLNNIGAIYYKMNNTDYALIYYGRSLILYEEVGDKQGMSYSLNNIGVICNNKGDAKSALDHYGRSLKIQEEIGDKPGIAYSLNNIAGIYLKLAHQAKDVRSLGKREKNYNLAEAYADSSLHLSKEIGFPENIKNAEETLSLIDEAKGNYTSSYEHYKKFIFYRDSITNIQTRNESVKNQVKYEFEKKEAVIKEQRKKEKAVTEEKNHKQQIIIVSAIIGLILVLIFAVFIFRSLKTARLQKLIIERKQKDILDSIHYAKRIQRSFLPTEKYILKSINKLKKNN